MGKLTFGATGGLSYQVDKVSIGGTAAPKCPRCNDRVYFNEEKRAVNKSWHIKCFNCATCKKKLDSAIMATHEEEIYCRHCHKKEFGPKGYGFAGGAAGLAAEYKAPKTTNTAASSVQKPEAVTDGSAPVVATSNGTNPSLAPRNPPNPNDPNSCPRCGKKVYFAEEVKALGKKFHKLCFKCGNCNKMLEPGRCSTHDNDLYCNNCYGRKFGPKGYGFAGGAGTMLAADVDKMTINVQRQDSSTETEVTKKKKDPISRQQRELVESGPKRNLPNGVIYGASNSIFDSRKDQRSVSGGNSPNDMQSRASPLPQDQQNVVLVPHERTRFSPNITQEEVRKSPQNEQSWSGEEFRRSPMPQEQSIRSQSNGSPAFQDIHRINQVSPNPQEQRTSPADRSPADRSTSPRYGNNLHPNGAYYSPNSGSVEELSRYNDNSIRSGGQQGGPSPIDHLVSNMYTRSTYQQNGHSYGSGEPAGPNAQSYQGDMQRTYRSVEDLSDARVGYEVHHVGGSHHAKSASIDGSMAYGVGSDASVAAAVAAARAEYGHVSEVPEYVNPMDPSSHSQYNQSAGPNARAYQPEPQYVKSEYGPPSNYGQATYGQNGGYYNPQYQPRPLENAAPYESGYRGTHQPPSYSQLGSEAYSHSNAHGYHGQNTPAFSSAVDAVFSATMPTVHQ